MKKLLLIAVAAFAIVACKKDKDEPVAPNGGGGNNGGGGTQTEQPTPVPAGFVKKIEVTGQETKTTTFNVENNVLKGWTVVTPQGTVTKTLDYDGKNLKKYTYESKFAGQNAIKIEYDFTYKNNKLAEVKRTRENMSDIYDVVVDDKGRITSKTVRAVPGGWEGGTVWTATFTYTNNSLVVKSPEGQTYSYTYENENVKELQSDTGVYTFGYNTDVVNDLNFEYFRWVAIVELFTRHSQVTLGNPVMLGDPFVESSKNLLSSNGTYEFIVTEKQGTNKPKTVVKKFGGSIAPYATIRYSY